MIRNLDRLTQTVKIFKTPFAFARALGISPVTGKLLIAAGQGEAHGLNLNWMDNQGKITGFQSAMGYQTTPFASISPDGSMIAVLGSATKGRRRQPYDWFNFGILILGPKEGQETWTDAGGVFGGSKPRWSPDGRQIVCVENVGVDVPTVAVMNAKTGRVIKRSPIEGANDASFDSSGNIVVTLDGARAELFTPSLTPIKPLALNAFQPECGFEPKTITYLSIESNGTQSIRLLNTKTLVERDLATSLGSKR